MKKSVIFWITCCTALILLAVIFVSSGQVDNVIEREIEKRIFRVDNSILSDPGIHVIMVGTGAPNYDPIRNPACVAVIAGGEFLLFDTGDGCTKTMDSMDLPILDINTIFLTHFHSDHINDLGQLVSHTWVQGRKEPIHVYGPPGVDNVVNGFASAAKEDIDIRSSPHSYFPLDPELAVGKPHQFVYPEDGKPIVVWQKNGIVVKAFKNDHADVRVSCGYRIEYANRVVVISGDTIKCDNVTQNSKNADLLIHDSCNREMIKDVARVFEKSISPHGIWMGKVITQMAKHHADTLDVAHVAKTAGAKKLVLYHIAPPIPDNWLIRKKFLKGMSDVYQGPIIISKDRDRFYLEPGSE